MQLEAHVHTNTRAYNDCFSNGIREHFIFDFGLDEQYLGRWLLFCCRYKINQQLRELDEAIAAAALFFHPRSSEKIGCGLQGIKVSSNKNLQSQERGISFNQVAQ